MAAHALIGQSGGPTSVINASLLGVVDRCRDSGVVGRTYGMRYGIEGFLEERLIDFDRVPRATLDLLRTTPSSALGSCRYKLKDADLPRVLALLKKFEIRYLFMIGGNDTMDTIHRIEHYCRNERYEFFGVGVPKTVDNDLYGTDHTPGYPSASRYVALSVAQSARLAADMQRVDKFVVNQTVGRDSGWLAASSALARKKASDAPHLIVVPERPLERDSFVDRVKDIVADRGFAYIVVGEGAVWRDGTPVSASRTRDGFSNIEFGAMGGSSAALSLHSIISEETGYRGEFQITESLPMCADDRTSDVDVDEAYRCGHAAAELVERHESGVMVTIERAGESPYRSTNGTIPLADVAVRAKPMESGFLDGDWDVSDRFLRYLRPLVGPLPTYAQLASGYEYHG